MSKLDEFELVRLAPDLLRSDDFHVTTVSITEHSLDIQFLITPDPHTVFGARVPLVDSVGPTPFLYMPPEDESGFLHMLRIWLDEETATGCENWALRTVVNGVPYFEVAGYGFRRADEAEHARLTKSARSGGWDNRDVTDELRRNE